MSSGPDTSQVTEVLSPAVSYFHSMSLSATTVVVGRFADQRGRLMGKTDRRRKGVRRSQTAWATVIAHDSPPLSGGRDARPPPWAPQYSERVAPTGNSSVNAQADSRTTDEGLGNRVQRSSPIGVMSCEDAADGSRLISIDPAARADKPLGNRPYSRDGRSGLGSGARRACMSSERHPTHQTSRARRHELVNAVSSSWPHRGSALWTTSLEMSGDRCGTENTAWSKSKRRRSLAD
jgi:hypothetical protein